MRLILTILLLFAGAAPAQEMSALARIDPAASVIRDVRGGATIDLALSQPVPWRLFTLDDPPRLVVDFDAVAFEGVDMGAVLTGKRLTRALAGPYRDGWSRLVLAMAQPMVVEAAALHVKDAAGGARLLVTLARADAQTFAAQAGLPPGARFAMPDPVVPAGPPMTRQIGDRPLRIVIDPGHGGLDPGAEAEGLNEAQVILTFARELRATLAEEGIEVTMTREADVFVPLETRVTIARAARADAFISLHADALAAGVASGATVYTLSPDASEAATGTLVQRHEGGDLLAGLDLTGTGDEVSAVLMDLASIEVTPRSEALADALVIGLSQRTGDLHKRPRLRAAFSVLKAPDIPSVLVELGFLSSAEDRARLMSREWRSAAIAGMRDAILAWAQTDAAQARLLRR